MSKPKPNQPVTVLPRPAGTIIIQPGEDEAAAVEKLRQENSGKQEPPAPVKPTAQDEEERHE